VTTLYEIPDLETKAKHLDNILKIISIDNYDEVTMHYLRAYCEMSNLIDDGNEPNWVDVEKVKEMIK